MASKYSHKTENGGFFAESYDENGKLDGFAYAASREEAEEKAGKMAARIAALEAVAVAAHFVLAAVKAGAEPRLTMCDLSEALAKLAALEG